MNTYTLKNFRVFGEQGATIKVAPLTILTGCNSGGKSSITKSMMLLQPFFHKLCKDIRSGNFGYFSDYQLDFARGQHKLGSFENAVNWSAEVKKLSIEYTFFSSILWKDVDVELKFAPIAASHSLRAYLCGIVLKTDDKILYEYSSTENKDKTTQLSRIINSAYSETGIAYLAENKGMLIDAVKRVDEISLINEIYTDAKDINEEEALREEGIYIPDSQHKWSNDDWQQIIKSIGKDNILYCLQFGESLVHLCGKTYQNYIKPFLHNDYDGKNGTIVRDAEKHLDWDNSKHQYEFQADLIYPLHGLQQKMDSVQKNDFVEWVQNKFITPLTNEWYNTDIYKGIALGFAQEYVASDYKTFTDFYRHYEDAYLQTCDGLGYLKEGSAAFNPLSQGTCNDCPDLIPIFTHTKDEEIQWNLLKDEKKFEYMFDVIQREAGYWNPSCLGGPEIEFPEEKILKRTINMLCVEALANGYLLSNATFVEINRANQQRCYTFESQGTSFNQLLEDYNHAPIEILKKDENDIWASERVVYEKGSFAKKWLKTLADIDDFSLELAPEGIGYYIYLFEGDHKILLSDMGFGMTPLLSMLLHIEIIITQQLQQEHILPTIICIEEPESHLHPKYQSLLADVFADVITMNVGDSGVSPKVNLVLETHSEYLIRRLQVMVAKQEIESSKIAIHYMSNNNSEGKQGTKPIKLIEIESDGSLSDTFGSGFFDEANNSYLQLIEQKNEQ